MTKSLKSADLSSGSVFTPSTKSAFSSGSFGFDSTQPSASRASSQRDIGRFDRVFTSSGSVRRNFPDVFRFTLDSRTRIRTYVTNRFSNSAFTNRRMVVDLLNDNNLRRIGNVNVDPNRIGAITNTLDRGTYRIRISTNTNDRGRYDLDMVRL
jgi:hypothetical protein